MVSSQVVNLSAVERDSASADRLAPAGQLLSRCIQCGTCTASCPANSAMDLSPRRMWRMVQLGLVDEVLHSKTMWLCSLCYQCQVRCPRGIPLTETITHLKQMAMEQGLVSSHQSRAFYKAFADVMRRYGRNREMEFMLRYFMQGNPLTAFKFVRMGAVMMMRGKVHPELPVDREGRSLDRLFERVAELEAEA
jgi:heterodisulfide reductase subunit C